MANENWTPDRDRVQYLAYQYWMERGCTHGCHEDDWLRAEQEIRRQRGEAAPVAAPDRTVVGIFHNMDDARTAYDKLITDGFTREEVGVVANRTGTEDLVRDRTASESGGDIGGEVATDAGIGAALGGVGGLLLGFAGLAIPGVGPVLAAGPILAALGGAGLGAAAGGLIGALTEHGVPEEDARYYAEGVRRGDILVTVHARGERADRAAAILDGSGAVDINDRVSAWRKRGWTDHDATATPLTSAELQRERDYYAAADKQAKEWSRRKRAAAAQDDVDRSPSRVYIQTNRPAEPEVRMER